MGNLKLDFSNVNIFHKSENSKANASDYVYRDIDTSSIVLNKNANGSQMITTRGASNYDAAAVKAALKNIINFKFGGSILEPTFGIGDLYQLIYSPYDKFTTSKMINTLKSILTTWEPRIQILSMPTSYDADSHEFSITINYNIIDLNINDSLIYNLKE